MGEERVLVVDDEDLLRQMLCRKLCGEGYDAIGAENGRVAVDILRDRPVAVVITDLSMPERDGLEVIGHLRKEAPRVGIIAMSAAEERYLEAALRLGATRTFPKPFDLDEMVQAVRELIRSAG